MAKKQIMKIAKDGKSLSGIYTDLIQGLGEMDVSRASSVDYNDVLNQWVIEPHIGPYANSCLLQTFERRGDAIAAEVELLSEQHLKCLL